MRRLGCGFTRATHRAQKERVYVCIGREGTRFVSRVVVHVVPLKRGRLAVETARAAHEHGGTVLFGLCDEDVGLPSFVVNEFRKFLRCGVLAHGFARIRCGDGVFERLLPFSCKGR